MGDLNMRSNSVRKALAAVFLTTAIVVTAAPAGFCQRAAIMKDPKTGQIELKALTSKDLKDAISHAVTSGDMEAKDGKALIDKITDIETLMDQFDFIRDQQRRLIGSYGSLMH
jgi:hypothetical protein